MEPDTSPCRDVGHKPDATVVKNDLHAIPSPWHGARNPPFVSCCLARPAGHPGRRAAPVDARSDSFIAFIGATRGMHPDFGGDSGDPSSPIYGIPYATVPGSQP